MDGGRRKLESLDGPLAAIGGVHPGAGQSRTLVYRTPARGRRSPASGAVRGTLFSLLTRRGTGWLAAFLLLAATGCYGATLGGHWTGVGAAMSALPDALARGTGFAIARVEVEGQKILTDEEILSALDTGPGQSLLFLDAGAARERLMANPLVLDATVRKLYPDRLAIAVVEREPYALWQRGRTMSVMAADGTVIEGIDAARFADLPLLVGRGADTAAKSILGALTPYPELRGKVYAMVRVGNRRWNLRLTNGMDVKLPAQGLEEALAGFVRLERSAGISDRDVVELDLRVPGFASIRLSEEAAAALAEADEKKRAGT